MNDERFKDLCARSLEETILTCLKDKYKINATSLTFLPLGADPHASVYKANTPNKCYFIKIKDRHFSKVNTFIIDLLQRANIQQIVPIIHTTDGNSFHSINNFSLIVYPFIDGQNGFSVNLNAAQWHAFGKVMRQIHDICLPSSNRAEIRYEEYSPKWRETARTFLRHIDSLSIVDEITSKFQFLVRQFKLKITKMINRAEQLADKIKRQSTAKFVLCHSDIHAGNIMIDKNDKIYMVDWDEPIL